MINTEQTPKFFSQFLKREIVRMNVAILLESQVTGVDIDSGRMVDIQVELESPETVDMSPGSKRRIPCRNLVIAAGPWSQRVFGSLFPASTVEVPYDQDSKSGNFLQLEVSGYTGHRSRCDQVYLQGLLGERLDLSDYIDGRLYVGGYLAGTQELSEKVTDVKAQPGYVDQMMQAARSVLAAPSSKMKILDEGRAYRPIWSIGHPITSKVALEVLMENESWQTAACS